MRDYYIFKSGRLKRHENTLEFEYNDGKKVIPVNDIHAIHLFGEVDLNTKVITFLNQHGIPVHFYNYYGYYSGSFYPRERLLSGFLLVKQVQHYLDREKRMNIAGEMVRSAVYNMLTNLKHYKKNGKDTDRFIIAIHKEAEHLLVIGNNDNNSNDKSKESTMIAIDIPTLMGIEGKCREHYYSSFDTILREEFRFEKRSRIPPENMLNSLISFGNSLLYATVLSEIYHTQLSPVISYLHEPGERRYSLALDISEVFKPVIVDRIIFNLVNNRIIKEEHFFEELNGCYLNENGKRIFVEEYQKKLNTTLRHTKLKRHVTYQRLIRLECYKLVKHILGDKRYTGFKSNW